MADEKIPDGPEGVWLEYADGTRYDDLPIIFTGYDETGCAQFDVLTPRDGVIVSAGARVWPGMTSLAIPKLVSRADANSGKEDNGSETGGIVPPHITDRIPGHEGDQP